MLLVSSPVWGGPLVVRYVEYQPVLDGIAYRIRIRRGLLYRGGVSLLQYLSHRLD